MKRKSKLKLTGRSERKSCAVEWQQTRASVKASAASKGKTLRLTCPFCPFSAFRRLVAGLMAVAYNTLRFVVLGA